ncbi:hypothetical protein GJ496_006567 [Pomphorhynchus laevis]|nr:hypothetical protein GJ496_006567 [Pomphorhynchus laevis]
MDQMFILNDDLPFVKENSSDLLNLIQTYHSRSPNSSHEFTCTSCCVPLPVVGHCTECDRLGGFGLLCVNCLCAHRFMHLLRTHQIKRFTDEDAATILTYDTPVLPLPELTTSMQANSNGLILKQPVKQLNTNRQSIVNDLGNPTMMLFHQLIEQLSILYNMIKEESEFKIENKYEILTLKMKTIITRALLISKTLEAISTDQQNPQQRFSPDIGRQRNSQSNLSYNSNRKASSADNGLIVTQSCKQSVDMLLNIINERFAITKLPPKISISSSGQIFIDNETTTFKVRGIPRKESGYSINKENSSSNNKNGFIGSHAVEIESISPKTLTPPVRFNCRMIPLCISRKFGYLGPAKGQFNSPHGFAVGSDNEIIIADTNNHRIQIFNNIGEFKHQFGVPGCDNGELWYPRKVIYTPHSDHFVVCDRGNERSRMQVFSRDGQFLKKISIKYIDIVAGLAIGSEGHIVAVDSVSPTVFTISENGDLLKWFDCSNNMKEPSDIAIYCHEYYICDFKGHCVAVFNEDGCFCRRIGCENVTNFPSGIEIDSTGRILVGDSHGNRFHVAIFSKLGELLFELECPYVKVSRCCGLKIIEDSSSDSKSVITLAKTNHHVLILSFN